jgi:hypothetical protein
LKDNNNSSTLEEILADLLAFKAAVVINFDHNWQSGKIFFFFSFADLLFKDLQALAKI